MEISLNMSACCLHELATINAKTQDNGCIRLRRQERNHSMLMWFMDSDPCDLDRFLKAHARQSWPEKGLGEAKPGQDPVQHEPRCVFGVFGLR